MKNGNWIALDKNIVGLLPHGRSYTIIEALISFTIDIDNDKPWTINGYANQWGWSRNKVRKFTEELRTVKGHVADRKGTGKGHHISLKINNLHEVEDKKGTVKGQERDRKRYTTIKPNPKPNPKPNNKDQIFVDDIVQGWNEVCSKNGFPKVAKLTPDRRKKVNTRLKTHPEQEFWGKVFNAIVDTPFLAGKNEREWKVTFDWLFANDENSTKIYEGNYDKQRK
jgi:hypothetical protein